MSLRDRLRNPIVQQYAIEIVFPLLGYFLFDWNILIIGIYYLIDLLAAQILFFRRVIKVRNEKEEKSSVLPLVGGMIAFLMLFSINVIWFTYLIHHTQLIEFEDIWTDFIVFLKAELWFLFPLVLLMYYIKDQFTFYAPRRYLIFGYKKMLKWEVFNSVSISTLFLLFGALWFFVKLPNALVVVLFVIIKLVFDFTLKKYFFSRMTLK